MTKGKAIVLGIFTAWPPLYMLFFFATFFIGDLDFDFMMKIHVATMLESFILLIFYITNTYNNYNIPHYKRSLWTLILFMLNAFAMPVYWYLYIWKGEEDYY